MDVLESIFLSLVFSFEFVHAKEVMEEKELVKVISQGWKLVRELDGIRFLVKQY